MSEKDKLYDLTYMWNKKKKIELIESKDILVVARGKQWGVTEMGELVKRYLKKVIRISSGIQCPEC